MKAVEAPWYNEALPGSWALEALSDIPALPVYVSAAAYVPSGLPVVDLGCGTGRFAEALHRLGHVDYVGLDFAADVIEEARRYCGPSFDFRVEDLRFWGHIPDLPEPACYTILETLEHLDDDRDLVQKLRPGSPVVFSVPSFWSESHVRVFPTMADVRERYGDLLDIVRCHSIVFDNSTSNTVHVCQALRR